MSAIALPVFLLGFAFALRFMTLRLAGSSAHGDPWFWKTYVQAVRRDGRFPPLLPQYRLDTHQWHPPLFPWLLIRLPVVVFPDRERWLAIGLDLLRLVLVVVAAPLLGGGDPSVAVAAGIFYATAPVLVLDNVHLSPRALAAVFLDGACVLALLAAAPGGSPWLWPAAALLGSLVLLTHRITTQLLVFLCVGGAVLARDIRIFLLLPASLVLAFLVSVGFYGKVLRAHLDHLRFWHRNWPWLHADPIRESPVYGGADHATPANFHRAGFPGVIRQLMNLLRLLPGGWVYLAMAGLGAFVFPWPGAPEGWVRSWVELVLVFSLTTTFLPPLKSLGAGSLYLYNAPFPLALAWAWVLQVEPISWITGTPRGAALSLVASMAVIAVLWANHARRRSSRDEGWEEVLNFLREAPPGVVFCLPQQYFDEIACRTGQPVAYGGHGFGLRELEPLFPRLLVSVSELRQRFQVRYFVVRDDSLTDRLIEDLPAQLRRMGRYRVYTLEPGLESRRA